jgi:hypothetical protein
MATTFDDTMSVTSSHVLPAGPHPTPQHTIAGDIPTYDFVANKLQGLDIGASAIQHSDPGKHNRVPFSPVLSLSTALRSGQAGRCTWVPA